MNLEVVKDYKVLVIGDGIVDEYTYVTTIGKSVKENSISTKFKMKELWNGGAWAAAKHIESFCQKVDVMTGHLVMWNRRYVDDFMHKLFTLHQPRNAEMIEEERTISNYDLVIVTDFGHGYMTKNLIEKVCNEAKYLCVNTQTNSTNYGFNMITKYPRADLVVIDELEARLATHDRDSPLEELVPKLGFSKVIVTKGNKGAMGYDGNFYTEPCYTDKVIDTMGAGDAFLCVVSPFAKAGFDMEDLLKIGNAAGAVKVGIIGHQQSVTKESLEVMLEGR